LEFDSIIDIGEMRGLNMAQLVKLAMKGFEVVVDF